MLRLAYRLVAHGIGGKTVRELNEGPQADSGGMDTEEFMTWAAYFSLEPTHETRADAHVAMILSAMHNSNRPKGKPAKKAVEFLPQWHKEARPRQTAVEMKHVMQMHILAMGGEPEAVS